MLTRTLTFSPEQDETFFQELPASAAVFLLRGDGEPYVSKTANLRRRLQRLLGVQTEKAKRLNLRDRVREAEFTPVASDFESQFLLYKLLREKFPKTYNSRLRLRPAPLLKLHLENEYPRASVTTRLGKLQSVSNEAGQPRDAENSDLRREDERGHVSNLYYGPFPSRAAAEKFANDALDFFKMRRCVDDLHPDPSFPGCIYSEMKMCLAPCFKGCSDGEYAAEAERVRSFFDSRGESLVREFSQQREHASAELAFEEAAAIHAKLEKLKPLLSQLPEIVQRVDRLQAIVVQASAEPGAVNLFRFAGAILQGPVPFSVEQSGEPQSMESRIQEKIAEFPSVQTTSGTARSEHLAILRRWYYRSHRAGEIFFADTNGNWPLRRLVRGIGRVYRDEKEQEPISFSATQALIPPSQPE